MAIGAKKLDYSRNLGKKDVSASFVSRQAARGIDTSELINLFGLGLFDSIRLLASVAITAIVDVVTITVIVTVASTDVSACFTA